MYKKSLFRIDVQPKKCWLLKIVISSQNTFHSPVIKSFFQMRFTQLRFIHIHIHICHLFYQVKKIYDDFFLVIGGLYVYFISSSLVCAFMHICKWRGIFLSTIKVYIISILFPFHNRSPHSIDQMLSLSWFWQECSSSIEKIRTTHNHQS